MFGVEHDMLAREILEVNTFELIEEQTIDIESIEEIKVSGNIVDTRTLIINELVKAVKHLNKEIQSIKEK